MFRHRRRTSQPAPPAPAPAAASAAAQAFLANRASNATLSSAAAAAALRAQTTSPAPVSQVQTKRTQRRGSDGSGGLVRRGSSGSMTERTFRDPSPSDRQSRANAPPPIPAVPKKYALQRRPSSAEPSQRILSPPPKDRGVSLDRGPGMSYASPRHRVNFSRPISPPASPTSSRATPDLEANQAENVRHTVREAASTPVKRKKKKLVANIVEGSHLAEGSTPVRPRGSAIDATSESPPEPVPPLPQKASGRLTKQPSVVREVPEEDETSQPRPENASPSVPSAHSVLADAKPNGSTLRTLAEAPDPLTNKSLQVVKHNPPERSKSPTKSAMKQPSSRGDSPAARSSSTTRQDVSDTVSNTSDDQRNPPQKRRVRVSFDDDALMVGEAADTINSSPVIYSPQSKDPAKRGWFTQHTTADDVIQPVPLLPSFDSIRGRKDHADTALDMKESLGNSSDQALGNIVAQSVEQSPKPFLSDPLPPEVTSVEDTGHHSDSEDEMPLPSQNGHATPTETKPLDSVPTIAIMPATPSETHQDKTLHMPGEFPDEAKSMVESNATEAPVQTPGTVGIAEPTPEVKPEAPAGQIAESAIHRPSARGDDSDDSSDSIYSDAAEDASDGEGDGFGSINAIVDSPVNPPSETSATVEDHDQSPSIPRGPVVASKDSVTPVPPNPLRTERGTKKASDAQDFRVNNHDSKPLADLPAKPMPQSRPRQSQETANKTRPMRTSMRGSPPDVEASPEPRSLRATTKPRLGSQETYATRPPNTDRSRPSPKPRALRAPREVDTDDSPDNTRPRMRSSMRGNAQHPENEPVRPRSQGRRAGPSSSAQDDPFVSSRRAESERFAPPMPKLQRQTSDGSDSSSSFKKARQRKHSTDGRYTMRRSMRATTEPTSDMRPSSPRAAPSASPKSGLASPRMRTTLRGPQAPKPQEASPRFSMRVMSPITESKAPKTGRPSSSRKANASDDERAPQRFVSRFGDSSDEDEPTPLSLAPVRGIPRTGDEGDSTELEDSDDNRSRDALRPGRVRAAQVPVPAADALNGLDVGRVEPFNGTTRAEGSRSADGKRKSWFGLRSRKKDESRIEKADTESAARPDTHLARSKHERANAPEAQDDSSLREDLPASSAASPLPSPKTGRLSRRHAPQRVASDSWPFHKSPDSASSGARPVTSDSKAQARPALGGRQPSGVSVSSRTGKKKKFPLLRRAFRLHD